MTMGYRAEIKDHFRETRVFTNRAITALVICSLLFIAIVVRLVYLQILHNETYTTLSENNRLHIQPLPPTRGLIYDRNGILLAQNRSAYRLELVPERITDMEATLNTLVGMIHVEEDDLIRFRNLVKRSRPFQPIPLRTHLSDEEVARIAIDRYRLPGVDITAHLVRHYPYGTDTVHALGYVGRINEAELNTIDLSSYEGTDFIGKSGVEKFYEDQLHGTVGLQQVETNAQGRTLRVVDETPPAPGQNLYLTLDLNLQRVAEEALGDNNGVIVALDPRDGSVLALVSLPTFDPNLFVTGIDSKTYRDMQESLDQPLFNRAIRGQYPPGSTLKPFVGLAALENGVSPHEHIFCPGWFSLPGSEHRYRDWKKEGHGRVDLDKAIVESCDVYFYDLALTLGIDRIHDMLVPFGFNQKTGIDMVGELPGLIPSEEWKRRVRGDRWYSGDSLNSGIGQGYMLATPLQLAVATATLARHGLRVQPHLLAAMQGPAARLTTAVSQPAIEVPGIRPQHWDMIINSMTRVIHSSHGTARGIGINSPFQIAGKTGTAQVFGIKQDQKYNAEELAKRLRDHALFIAFAPVEDPRIAIAVVVENGGGGGGVAAPIARKVMNQYLLGAPP